LAEVDALTAHGLEISTMYAVIMTGGKQYRVEQGNTLKVEKLSAEVGDSIKLDKVLMVGDGDNIKVGTPYIKGGNVTAVVKAQERAKKIEVIKFKRRKHHDKRIGHRQYYTELEITKISA